ncbi:hypothetical protein [Sphingomonas sp. AP4-R1]|nr:hypothetical protein [Sphingomonas sp. AP4-R1]
MKKDQKAPRKLIALGSARIKTKASVVGDQDEPILGGRYDG